ncbi:MAG: DUF4276 family protein [Magnetococcales bacterium]|nr:DUF4276 family protein [Magnetococcales bacterium]MBF0438404.1 DUF4276 family protein [Magnetococcales bacterium]
MQLVIFLEELSAKALLQELLPRLLPDHITLCFIVFEGKQDLEKQLSKKLKAWTVPDCRFIVLRDQDAGNCLIIKERLLDLCREGGRNDVLVRIACRELESWFLGDLAAVATAMNASGAATQQNRRKYRNPDALGNPLQELSRLAPTYQKVAGSRALGKVMAVDPHHNLSHSFNVFLNGIRRILEKE